MGVRGAPAGRRAAAVPRGRGAARRRAPPRAGAGIATSDTRRTLREVQAALDRAAAMDENSD